ALDVPEPGLVLVAVGLDMARARTVAGLAEDRLPEDGAIACGLAVGSGGKRFEFGFVAILALLGADVVGRGRRLGPGGKGAQREEGGDDAGDPPRTTHPDTPRGGGRVPSPSSGEWGARFLGHINRSFAEHFSLPRERLQAWSWGTDEQALSHHS